MSNRKSSHLYMKQLPHLSWDAFLSDKPGRKHMPPNTILIAVAGGITHMYNIYVRMFVSVFFCYLLRYRVSHNPCLYCEVKLKKEISLLLHLPS